MTEPKVPQVYQEDSEDTLHSRGIFDQGEKPRDVAISPAVVLPQDPVAARERIDEIRQDQRTAFEETIIETSPLRASLALQTIKSQITTSGTVLLNVVRGHGVMILSTFLTLDDLKERLKNGQVVLKRVSLDAKVSDLTQKCIKITTQDGHLFTVCSLPNDVLGIVVEDDETQLFQG